MGGGRVERGTAASFALLDLVARSFSYPFLSLGLGLDACLLLSNIGCARLCFARCLRRIIPPTIGQRIRLLKQGYFRKEKRLKQLTSLEECLGVSNSILIENCGPVRELIVMMSQENWTHSATHFTG
jgi:hypothetical protein